MTLGQRIQEHRLRLELSQEALGERLGVSRPGGEQMGGGCRCAGYGQVDCLVETVWAHPQ